MPKHRSHRYADKLIFRKSFPEIHRAIDRPYAFLGRRHRTMFHTPAEAYMMGLLASPDPRAGFAGLLHVWVDRECSKDKSFKKLLEFWAHQDYLMQKATRKLTKQAEKRKRKTIALFLRQLR